VSPGVYRATVRLAAAGGDKRITLTLRLGETFEQSRLVFSPLLSRFLAGEPFETRPVKISDSGRIRNELQTLCAEALELVDSQKIRLHFDLIPPEVISLERQRKLLDVLRWYKTRHPMWFAWMELVEPKGDRRVCPPSRSALRRGHAEARLASNAGGGGKARPTA
jgi:hypothetical protein